MPRASPRGNPTAAGFLKMLNKTKPLSLQAGCFFRALLENHLIQNKAVAWRQRFAKKGGPILKVFLEMLMITKGQEMPLGDF